MSVAITSLGMVSSLGHDVVTSCAAIRAGLSRPREITYFALLDVESQETTPLTGHPIHGLAEGFNIVGFWVRVGVACLRNLIAYGNLPDRSNRGFWSTTGLLGVTPRIDDSRFRGDETCTPEFIKNAYLLRLLEGLGYPLSPEYVEAVCVGHAGTLVAVERARSMIEEGQVERVILLAVDSYLDPMTLDWLAENERLKTDGAPAGITPGEAGACFLVESADSLRGRGARPQAYIHSPALDVEENHFHSDKTSQGVALARVISEGLSRNGLALPYSGTLISDFNGEHWRGLELGSARIRLRGKLGDDIRLSFPSESLGEVGAASGAVGVCLAVRSLVRGHAGCETVLVTSSSDYGEVGAIQVSVA